MNKRLSLYLKRWPIIIASLAVTNFVIIGSMSIYNSPKEIERIWAFSPCFDIKTSLFVNECKKFASEDIREISIQHGIPDSDSTYYIFGAYYDIVDFYILPESWTTKINTIASHFSKETINSLIPNSSDKELLSDEKNYYGIKVFDKTTNEGCMKDIITYYLDDENKEDYYIIFRENSLHLGSLNSSSNDDTIKIVNHLLNL